MTLSSKQRAELRGEAHHLKPLVHVGHQGLTDTLLQTIDDALRTHELVKIALTKTADVKPKEAAGEIAEKVGADVVQTIGRTCTLYRLNPDLHKTGTKQASRKPWALLLMLSLGVGVAARAEAKLPLKEDAKTEGPRVRNHFFKPVSSNKVWLVHDGLADGRAQLAAVAGVVVRLSLFLDREVDVMTKRSRRGVVAVALAAMAMACGGCDGPSLTTNQNTSVTQVSISPSSASSLTVGATTTLVAGAKNAAGQVISTSFTWTSSNASVASVSGGIVTAVAPGSAAITASANGVSTSVSVTVTASTVVGVSVTPASVASLSVGSATTLVPTARDTSGNTVSAPFTWSSSNNAIATVSSGIVSGVSVGTATITVSSSGYSATSDVTVVAATPGTEVHAALPTVFLDTQMPPAPDVGGRVITVASGGNLQSALNSANPGDVIELAAGATFTGNFTLPNKNTTGTKWIVIRPSNWQSLPAPGSRLTASVAAPLGLPVITSPNANPAIQPAAGAHHYRILGIEATVVNTVTQNYGIIELDAPSQTQMSQVPQYIVLDRMYIHGWPTLTLRRCVVLNSAYTSIIDSYLSECHEPQQDSQAIAGWNGPGPFKIVNNYLEGAAENVMFGGADAAIQGCVPSDIEIRHNHFIKPPSWKGKWVAKNLLELKNAQRVLIEGNIFENSWVSGQTGYAIIMKTVNQNGTAPWDVTQDVTVRYNLIRNVGAGFNIAASPDNNFPDIHARKITIHDNLIHTINVAPNDGDGRGFIISGDLQDVAIFHNTVWQPTNTALIFAGTPTIRTTWRDNVTGGGAYGILGDQVGGGATALNYFAPGGFVQGNVVTLSSASGYPAGNFYPTAASGIGFVNAAGLDFHLSASSPYKGKATDGRDPGADIDAVLQATNGVIVP